jgi:hypothetical protein
MTLPAHGTSEVNIIPQPSEEKPEGLTPLGRMLLEKQFHGDLVATSKGQMLTSSIRSLSPETFNPETRP